MFKALVSNWVYIGGYLGGRMAESVVLKVIHMFKNHHIGVTELTQHLVNILFILNTLMAAQAHLDMKK